MGYYAMHKIITNMTGKFYAFVMWNVQYYGYDSIVYRYVNKLNSTQNVYMASNRLKYLVDIHSAVKWQCCGRWFISIFILHYRAIMLCMEGRFIN